MSAVRHAMDYVVGFFVFGFFYGLLNPIITILSGTSSLGLSGDVYSVAMGLWGLGLVIYIIFGMFWFFRVLKEWQFEQGGL